MKIIISLSLALLSTACLKISDKPKDSPPESNPQPASVALPVLKPELKVSALPELHRYQVELPVSSEVQIVQRTSLETNETVVLPMDISNGMLKDAQVLEGQTYLYTLGVPREGKIEIQEEYEVQIPKDLEINQATTLTEKTEWKGYARIYIGPEAKITTSTFDLTIEGEELIGAKGLIQTFPKGTVTEVDQPGRSGGTIQVNVKKATGSLTIEMRGEAGGLGSPPGIQTESANYWQAWQATMGGRNLPAPLQGANGVDGKMGAPGGDTGSFFLQVREPSDLKCDLIVLPGAGGAGGPGGSGELKMDNLLAGSPGNPGPQGPAGQARSSCVRIEQRDRCL